MSLVSAAVPPSAAVPLFGALPDGSGLLVALLFRLVPALCIAALVGWDARRRSDNPRAWPVATVLAGLGGGLAAFVVGALYLVAGRDRPPADGRRRERRERADGRR